jgi:CBS-domain-containing membrane protein
MNSALERLLSLRVGDLMARSVVQVGQHQTMADAARLMQEHEVSGVPVVDDMGRCVGVLSGFDFANRERACAARGESSCGSVEHLLVRDRTDEPYHIVDVPEDIVESHMSRGVQTIKANATLMEAAREMCAAHIHRLIVLDGQQRPAGIVSSLDIVAAMVKSMEE